MDASGSSSGATVVGATGQEPIQAGSSNEKSIKTEIFASGSDYTIEVRHIKRGAVLAEMVERTLADSREKLLGILKFVLNTKSNHGNLNAICKIHSNCQCWISSSTHSDLLFNWLLESRNCSRDNHQILASDLKMSIGMRVRS
jgi:hypothetical protein